MVADGGGVPITKRVSSAIQAAEYVDGEYGRFVCNLGDEQAIYFPDLEKIDIPFSTVEARAYAAVGSGLSLSSWESTSTFLPAITSEHTYLSSHFEREISVESDEKCFEKVLSGEAEIAIISVYNGMEINLPEGIEFVGAIETRPTYCWYNKGDTQTAEILRNGFTELITTGRIERIRNGESINATSLKSVLLLSSYSKEMEWTSQGEQAVRDSFKKYKEPVSLFSYEMNFYRTDNREAQYEALEDYIRATFMAEYPDIIIATDNDALSFLKEYYAKYFYGTPVVFCGINYFDESMLNGFSQFATGITESVYAEETIDLALKLNPEINQVFVVLDNTSSTSIIKEFLIKELEEKFSNLTISTSTNQSYQDLVKTIESFDEDTVVLIGSYFTDGNRVFLPENIITPLISKASKLPVYCLMSNYVGYGALGGYVSDSYSFNYGAAEIAKRVLDGEDVASIPIFEDNSENLEYSKYIIDWQVMKEFNIPEEDLPKKITFLNKELKFYEQYPKETATAVIIILFAVLLIILLTTFSLIIRAKNKKVEMAKNNLDEIVKERTLELEMTIEKQNLISNSNPQVIFTVDREGKIIHCNPIAVKLFGYDNKWDALVNLNKEIAELIDEKQRNGRTAISLHERVEGVFREGYDREVTQLNVHGEKMVLDITYIRVPIKNDFEVICYASVITELADAMAAVEQANAKLNASTQTLDRVFNVMEQLVFRCDEHLKLVDVNQAVLNTFGYNDKLEALIRWPVEIDGFILNNQSDENVKISVWSKIKEAQKKGQVHAEYTFLINDKTLIMNCVFIRVPSGNGYGIVLYCNDITELRNAINSANAATQAKSEFLSSMSHEMRTPLNAIIGMSGIAAGNTDLEKVLYCVNKINEASHHLLGVINDVLDMSKIEANKMELISEEFNFEKALIRVANIINFRIDEKKQNFTVRTVDIPNSLIGDEQRFLQVLTNLLFNATKFTREGGTIRVTVQLVEEIDNICEILVSVKDNGIGMNKEQQKRLFKPFNQADASTTRRFGGTGLGLAISKRIVEMMNGNIWVESEENVGSEFFFNFKMPKGKSISQRLLAPNKNWDNVKILAVDDDIDILNYFEEICAINKLHCETAVGAEAAIEKIKTNGCYDIYFVDFMMPNVNGIDLAAKIKSNSTNKSVVIMVSSAEWVTIKDDAVKAGVDKFLQKPLFQSTIVDAINECIGVPDDKPFDANVTYDFSGRQLLIAEDIEVNCEVVAALLENTKIKIDFAENGLRAVEMFNENPLKYDLIFMDVHMPEMDGYTATKEIRQSLKSRAQTIPIVAMTANVFKEDIDKCFAAGMNAHIGKPLDVLQINEIIRKYIK